MKIVTQDKTRPDLPFEVRAASALGVSLVADALDYIGAPIFALPVIGDIADAIVVAVLFRLTGSRTSTLVNAIEFIPFIGDFVPTYTLTTLAWILRESRKRNATNQRDRPSPSGKERNLSATGISSSGDLQPTREKNDDLRTKLFRRYAVMRSGSVAE